MSKQYNEFDFIDINYDKLLDVKDNLYLIEKDVNKENNRFIIVYFNEDDNDWYKTIISNDNKEKVLNKFELLSNGNPGSLVFREDPIGYPNNNSVVAFSLDEKPINKDNIVYYEIVNGFLTKNEALISFAKSTKTIIYNSPKLDKLKEELSLNFPRSFISQQLRINNSDYWYEKKFTKDDIVLAYEKPNNYYQETFFNAKIINYSFDYTHKEWIYGIKKIEDSNSIETEYFHESDLELKFDHNHIKKLRVLKTLENEQNLIKNYFEFNQELEFKN